MKNLEPLREHPNTMEALGDDPSTVGAMGVPFSTTVWHLDKQTATKFCHLQCPTAQVASSQQAGVTVGLTQVHRLQSETR